MINLLEGIPGSGKSYEAVVYHVLPTLQSGRKVITNLPLKIDAFRLLYPELVHLLEIRKSNMPILGRWDAEAANRGEKAFVVGEFDEPARLQMKNGRPWLPVPSNIPLFGSVWDFYDEWRGVDGVGPLYVIDECHVSFPKPKRSNPTGTPDDVIQWFKISRHFGADVLLMTQRMSALEEDIAGLAEFHMRVRKAAFLGKPNHYIRRVFAGFRGGEISNNEREYLPQYFPLYKSHTQGQTVIENRDSDEKPDHLKWQRRGRICMFVGFAGIIWIVGGVLYDTFISKSVPKKSGGLHPINISSPGRVSPAPVSSAPVSPAPVSSAPVSSASVSPAPISPAPVSSAPADFLPDPLETKLLHMTGCMRRHTTGETVCTFSVSQNGMPVFHVTSLELQEIGYEFSNLGHCASVITWKTGKPRAVVCDAPSVGMSVAKIS